MTDALPETIAPETTETEAGMSESPAADSRDGSARPTRSELLDREGDAAGDYLEALFDIADLDFDMDIAVEGNRAMVVVAEANPGELAHLVGEDGRVLEALQELARLAATRSTGERSRLMLDIAGFRAARRAELVALGETAVDEARRTGAPVRMDPMTPFERKVVHDVVADAGLVSESEGEEPGRYVVIRTA